MQVCLDYQPAVSQCAGIGRYARVLAQRLPGCLADGDGISLFYFDFRRSAAAPVGAGVRVRPWRLMPGAWMQQCWKRFGWPPFDLLAPEADVYHFPNFIIPPLRRGVRAVVTIHDMSFVRFPDCAEPRNLAYLENRLALTVQRADMIIGISHFSAKEIVSVFPAAAGKVRPVPLGIDTDRFRRPGPEKIADMRRRLGLPRPYLLTVGTIEPRKNLPLLISAFDALDAFDLDLVIAGRPGWKCTPIFEAMRQSPRSGRIRHMNDVPDRDLPALYAGARLFVQPSLYEGFGFTPLEAMACGAPVVSSAGGSLPEVLGQAAVLVPEPSVEAWVTVLRGLLADPDWRARLAAGGPARAARFDWDETARETVRIYREVSS